MRTGLLPLCVVTLLAVMVSVAAAQDGRSVVLRDTGQVLLKDAEGDLATLELNLHNSAWKYASQTDATADWQAEGAAGKRFTGTLPVPDVVGAAISFIQTVTPGDEGVKVLYELQPTGPMILNGLQISLLLPTDSFGGKRLVVGGEDAAARSVVLPLALDAAKWQLGTHEGNSVQLGDDEGAVTLHIDKAYGLVIQDLRQWERDEFEIRIPVLFANEGQNVSNTDRWDVELTLTPGPIEVTGP